VGWRGPFAAEAASPADKPGALLELQCPVRMLSAVPLNIPHPIFPFTTPYKEKSAKITFVL